MSALAAYDRLLTQSREAFLLATTSALLAWDQETNLPKGAGGVRAKQLALLAQLQHERMVSPRMAESLAACESDADLLADAERAANVRELRRDHDRATKLPASLVGELAETESKAQHAWAAARSAGDYRRFRPWLDRMIRLQRQKADCLRQPGQSRWDALADLYEPGTTAAGLTALFGRLRERLTDLRQKARDGAVGDASFARVEVDEARQEQFVRAVVQSMGFDFQRGRIDRSAHPFCTTTGDDVRLTTRFRRDNVLDALGSTMHEAGHGLYEQGLEPAHRGTPLGETCSLGIHESQSRFWENHVGRSAAFWSWCWPLAQRTLGTVCNGHTADSVFRSANVVRPSLIRVEADEVTYDLHVMVRFELEREMIDGDLGAPDLPSRWDRLYESYLGIRVPDDRSGCLQDVHWSCGLFGYFPTYTLGNLYAAQLAAAMDRSLGGLAELLRTGRFEVVREWLRRNVHRHGRRHRPAELCLLATGSPLSAEPFLQHLERKVAVLHPG
ncbi:MAG: carboxypeptidase M32 [Planctomycetes bacterium]|nr:carboxypeptidase M32 [Planctomycetota bacterium]